MESKVKK